MKNQSLQVVRKKNLRVCLESCWNSYTGMKLLTIVLGAVDMILAVYAGYLLGVEKYVWALLVIGVDIVLTSIDSWVSYIVWEIMTGKRGKG